jgi:hypothetical protein
MLVSGITYRLAEEAPTMNLLFLPVALAFGFVIRPKGVAVAIYLAVDALLFTVQSIMQLLLGISGRYGERNAYWINGAGDHFTFGWGGFLSYALLNLVIIGIGIGLVLLGARLRTRRDAKKIALTG